MFNFSEFISDLMAEGDSRESAIIKATLEMNKRKSAVRDCIRSENEYRNSKVIRKYKDLNGAPR